MKKMFLSCFFFFLIFANIFAISEKEVLGKWKYEKGSKYFQYEFRSDGTYTYGLHVDNGPKKNGEFNGWQISGTFACSDNYIYLTVNKNFESPFKEGEELPLQANLISNSEASFRLNGQALFIYKKQGASSSQTSTKKNTKNTPAKPEQLYIDKDGSVKVK